MKVRVDFEIEGKSLHEVVEGKDAEELLTFAKARVARELGWKGMFVNAMTPLAFAQEAVRRYNESKKESYPPPNSAEDFIEFGEKTGHIEVLEP